MTHFRPKDKKTYRLKVKGWEKMSHANGNKSKLYFYQIKLTLKTNIVVRNKEGHYIKIKGSTPQKDIPIINNYAPKYINQILTSLKKEIDTNIIIVENFNTPHN